MTRKSIGNPTGIAFTPKYPYLKEEKYYLTLEFSGVLVFFEEVTFTAGETYKAAFNYVHRGPPIKMKFTALFCSDCYFGLDFEKNIILGFREYTGSQKIEFHPTDRKIELVPLNSFEAALSLNTGIN